ncbi:MAG: hypothetical protein Q7J27_00245 [Syntrophales bacterium]|nr:hypothetical protein [Syntrophales bacterium]
MAAKATIYQITLLPKKILPRIEAATPKALNVKAIPKTKARDR